MEEADGAPAGADGAGEEGCHPEDASHEGEDFFAGASKEGGVTGEREEGKEESEEFQNRWEGRKVVCDGDGEAGG